MSYPRERIWSFKAIHRTDLTCLRHLELLKLFTYPHPHQKKKKKNEKPLILEVPSKNK